MNLIASKFLTLYFQSEALHFDMDWKVPCIIYFAHKNLNDYYDLSGKEKLSFIYACGNAVHFHFYIVVIT